MPNYTLLLIDYDPRSLDLLRDPLEAMGYTVAIANNGREAMAAVRELRPALTFVEVMLPKKPGLEVCLEIKQDPIGRETKVVAMTSRFSAKRYRQQAVREYMADEFLEKPIDAAMLHPLLRRLLPGPPPPAPAGKHQAQLLPPGRPLPTMPPPPATAPIPVAHAMASDPRPEHFESLNQTSRPSASDAAAGAIAPTIPVARIPVPILAANPHRANDADEQDIIDHLDSVLSDNLFGD